MQLGRVDTDASCISGGEPIGGIAFDGRELTPAGCLSVSRVWDVWWIAGAVRVR